MARHEEFEYFKDSEYDDIHPISSDDPDYLYACREIEWGIVGGSLKSTCSRWEDVLFEKPPITFIHSFLEMNPEWDENNEKVRGNSVGVVLESVDRNNDPFSVGVGIPHAYGLTMTCAHHDIVVSNNRIPNRATTQDITKFLEEVKFVDLIAMTSIIRSGQFDKFTDLGSPFAGLFDRFTGRGDGELMRQESSTKKVKDFFGRKIKQIFHTGTLTFNQLPINTPVPENQEIDRFLTSNKRKIASRIFKLGIPTCSLFCDTTSVNWLYYPGNWQIYRRVISNLDEWNDSESSKWDWDASTRTPKGVEILNDERLDKLLCNVMNPYYHFNW